MATGLDGTPHPGPGGGLGPVEGAARPETLLLVSGLAWTVYALWYAGIGRTTAATLDAAVGLITLTLAAWARLRPQREQLAWDLAVGLAAAGLVLLALLSGASRSMSAWFLVLIPPVAAYQRGVRSARRWAVATAGLVLVVHVVATLFPVEPEFVASGWELLGAQVAMIAMVVASGVSIRRATDAGARLLANTHAQLQAVSDNIEVGVVITDADDRILVVNPAARVMFGAPHRAESELVGTRGVELLRTRMRQLGVDPGPLVQELQVIASAGEKVLRDEMELPAGVYERDYFPVRLPSGQRGHMWSFRDVSERRAMERLKDQFLSTISHELRTPLTKIQGSLRLVGSQVAGELPAQVEELLRIASTHADHLDTLVTDLLDLQDIHAGNLALNPQVCGLAPMLVDASDNVRAIAEAAGVRVEVEAPVDAVVRGDEERLTQVFTILLANAVKFSPAGGRVRVSVTRERANPRVLVADEGPGIPADGLEQVFERFRQLDASDARAKGGMGLGLAIARAIVEGHGGRIGVESHPGAGATFWVEIEGERSSQHAPLASA